MPDISVAFRTLLRSRKAQEERFAKAMWERFNPDGMAWGDLVGDNWQCVADEFRGHAKAIIAAAER